jgi:hypothetical protein
VAGFDQKAGEQIYRKPSYQLGGSLSNGFQCVAVRRTRQGLHYQKMLLAIADQITVDRLRVLIGALQAQKAALSSPATVVGGLIHFHSSRCQSGSPTEIVMNTQGFHCDRRGQNHDDLHQRSRSEHFFE